MRLSNIFNALIPSYPPIKPEDDRVLKMYDDIDAGIDLNITHEEGFIMSKSVDHVAILIEKYTGEEVELDRRRALLEEVIFKAQTELEQVNIALGVVRNAVHKLNKAGVAAEVKSATRAYADVPERRDEEETIDRRDTAWNQTAPTRPE